APPAVGLAPRGQGHQLVQRQPLPHRLLTQVGEGAAEADAAVDGDAVRHGRSVAATRLSLLRPAVEVLVSATAGEGLGVELDVQVVVELEPVAEVERPALEDAEHLAIVAGGDGAVGAVELAGDQDAVAEADGPGADL